MEGEDDPLSDACSPRIVVIGKRRYRTNAVAGAAVYSDDATDCEPDDGELLEGVEAVERGFRAKIHVPAALYGKLIGRGGENKKRLQQETQATITMPPRGHQGKVVISGRTQGAVVSCRTKIEAMVGAAARSMPMTHFISIPLIGAEFEHSLEQFREQSLAQQSKDGGIGGLSAELFQRHERLHLTCGALKLFDEDVVTAKECLMQCRDRINELCGSALPATIVVKGVQYMGDDVTEPTQMDVLYAKAEFVGDGGGGGLQAVVDYVASQFVAAGLLEQSDREHVKIHATLINSKWRRGAGAGAGGSTGGGGRAPPGFGGRRERTPFDGSKVLTKFAKFNFGASPFTSVHLSRMKPRAVSHAAAPDGYYEPEHILTLL